MITGHGGPQSYETSRLADLLDNRLTYGGKVATLMRRPTFPPGRFLVFISVRGRVDPRAIGRLERLGKLKKNPMTSSGIELATFQFVA
jgi:hypothetical protein